MTIFPLLLLGHFVADYPLQTDFVAKFKCRKASLPAVPWYYVMSGHCATHAVAVYLVTGSLPLATLELVAHFGIDVAKCEGWTNIHVDQALHVVCKIAWTALFLANIR